MAVCAIRVNLAFPGALDLIGSYTVVLANAGLKTKSYYYYEMQKVLDISTLNLYYSAVLIRCS